MFQKHTEEEGVVCVEILSNNSNSYSLLSVHCVPDNNPIYALLDIVIIYITFVIERKSIRRLGININ